MRRVSASAGVGLLLGWWIAFRHPPAPVAACRPPHAAAAQQLGTCSSHALAAVVYHYGVAMIGLVLILGAVALGLLLALRSLRSPVA